MTSQRESIHLSPMHLKALRDRLRHQYELKEHIRATMDTVGKYAQAGVQLCDSMSKLTLAFRAFPEFNSDATFHQVSQLLTDLVHIFRRHYEAVGESIIQPLAEFVRGDIKKAEDEAKVAAHEYESYTRLLEQFVQPNTTQKRAGKAPDLTGKVQGAYWTTVRADFAYATSLDLVEAKKLYEIAVGFVAFVNMASVMYAEAHDLCSGSKETLGALMTAMQESKFDEKKFQADLEQSHISLEQYFRIWVTRFVQPFKGSRSLEHEGLLWKKGTGMTKSWQMRYFVLRDNTLSYHHGVQDCEKPQGELNLLCTSVKSLPTTGCFTIISPTKTYTLRAMTDHDRDEWVAVIQNNIEHLLTAAPAPRTVNPTNAPNAVNPQSFAFNQRCADCGAPNPGWCCINWGVCVCIHCCGVHRSLTTSISKPRSLTLDRLDPATAKLFEVIGNERANQVLEEDVGQAKIAEGCSKESRAAFIRRKYVSRDFMKPVAKLDVYAAVKAGDYITVFRAICAGVIAEGKDGYTPLHLAACMDDPVMALLVALNMPVTNTLNKGWSALAYAAYYGNKTVARALIDVGCMSDAQEQMHPYEIATAGQNEDMSLMFFPFWHGPGPGGKRVPVPPVPFMPL